MMNNIYFSHGFACDLTDTDLIRRILKHLGYNVIEHEGIWTADSLQKFLDCEYKLFFTPDFSECMGRGQAEMIEAALSKNQKIYVVSDFLDIKSAKGSEPYIMVDEVDSLTFIRDNYKTEWATCNFKPDFSLYKINLLDVCPVNSVTTYFNNSSLMLGAAKAYLDKK